MDFGLSLNGINEFGDVYSTKLYLSNSTTGGWDDVQDLINAGGSGSSIITSVTLPLSITNKVLSINLSTYLTSAQINTLLNAYTNTTGMNLLLNAKQDIIIAGTNITKSGNTISVNDLSSLNFKYQNNNSVALSINNTNKLLWDNVLIYNATETLTACSNSVTITGPFTATTNTSLGQRYFTYDPTYQYTQIILKDSGNTARTLTSSLTGALVWNNVNLLTTSDLSAYSTTAAITALLNAKENLITTGTFLNKVGSTLNVDLSAYTNTASLTTLLNAKQSNITTSSNLSMQDLTCRFLTGGNVSSAFTITGSALITFKDSSNNTLMNLQNGSIEINKPLDCVETSLFRKTIQISDSTNSLSGQLYIGTGNKLKWQSQNVVTEDFMFTDRIAKMQFGTEFNVISQASTGLMIIAKNQSFQNSTINFTNTSKSLINHTQNSVDYLSWGGDFLATHPYVTAQLATKQNVLTGISQSGSGSTSNTTFAQTSLTIDSAAVGYSQSDLKFQYSNVSPHVISASATIFRMYAPHASTEISWLNAYGYPLKATAGGLNVVCGGTLTQSSDARLKDNIEDADTAMCMELVNSVSARTYRRKDIEQTKTRLGFVSQELLNALPKGGEFQNLVAPYSHEEEGGDKIEYLGVDYSRLTAVLWTCVKSLTQRIEIIENKLNALTI